MPKAAKKTSAVAELAPGIVTELPLAAIDLDPDQPRKDVPQEHIDALAADIGQSRVKQPITVRPHPEQAGRYIIRYGECRYRASLQAKKKTIPCLLDTEEDTQGDPLARLLDQVKENHIRRDLNPMEWAGVLRRMRQDHSIKSINAIEDTLKGHGITNMSRSQISNLMRLQELPEWAQEMIRAGRLTAAHGKHLLTALRSEPVTEALREALVDEGEELSVRALQDHIFEQFRHKHITLDGYWQPFDYKQECAAAGCQKMRKITTEHDSATFCLDKQCYKAKEQAACEARAQARTERLGGGSAGEEGEEREYIAPQVDADNRVDIDQQEDVDYIPLNGNSIDTTECQQCPHYHIATWKRYGTDEINSIPGCFASTDACYRAKADEARQRREAERQAEAMITAWLRGILVQDMLDNDSQAFALMAACALELEGFDHWDLEPHDFEHIGELLAYDRNKHEAIIRYLLNSAETEILVPLALANGIDIGNWELSEAILELCDRQDLEAMCRDNLNTVWPETDPDAFDITLPELSDDEIRKTLLRHAGDIAPPSIVDAVWQRLISEYQDSNEEAAA